MTSHAFQKEVKEKKGDDVAEDREDRKIRRYLEMFEKQQKAAERKRFLKERNSSEIGGSQVS